VAYQKDGTACAQDEVGTVTYSNGTITVTPKDGLYLTAADLSPVNDEIINPDAAAIWTVTVNDDGSYSFRCGEQVMAVAQTVKDAAQGTYNNTLYLTEAEHSIKWTLESCNAENKSFVIHATEMNAKYGHVYLEWYANKSAFSAYDTSAERATEANFGFQFYVLNAG
jgi:hypothetical protein